MTKHFSSLLLMAFGLLLLSSCLGTNDDEAIYYDDTAITAFSLGTLSVTHHTTSYNGADSTYTSSLTGSNYRFSIDQVSRTIYNTDSLPVGTSVSRVLATISTKNSGIPVICYKNQAGEDSLAMYSSTDSIDFTSPIRVRIFNLSGTAYREYTIKVNVHQQTGDEFAWHETAGDSLHSVAGRKIVAFGNEVYLFGAEGGSTVCYRKAGNLWNEVSEVADDDAYKSMTVFGSYLYTIIGSNICRTQDLQSWETVAPATGLTQLLGASPKRLYALTADGISYSTDGTTWAADGLDTDAANLPNENLSLVVLPSKTNTDTYSLLLAGTRNGANSFWSKVEENAAGSESQAWAYYNSDPYNRRTLPYLENLQVVAYGDNLLATGGDFSAMYTSPDFGLTWTTDATYDLPVDLGRTAAPFALGVDSSYHLFVSRSGRDYVYTGQLARLGWDKQDNLFTK